jgi:hypothetical protein
MSAPLIDLAQVVTDLLNSPGAFTPPLNAVRTYDLYYELPDAVAAPKVSVFPTSDKTMGRATREDWHHDLVIEIAVQKKLVTDSTAEKDVLVTLADNICEYVRANMPERTDQRRESLSNATVESFVQNPLLKQHKLFTSAIRLTFSSLR